MRRFALLGLVLMLPGCADSGFGTFLSDTQWNGHPNTPIGDSENMRRVRAQATAVQPLQPEAGNVWPGPPPEEATLMDIERQNGGLPQGTPVQPGTVPQGDPGPQQRGRPVPYVAPNGAPSVSNGTGPGSTLQTPNGTSTNAGGNGRAQLYTSPQPHAGGILVPNGNGTSTLVAPDGTVSTVPTPK